MSRVISKSHVLPFVIPSFILIYFCTLTISTKLLLCDINLVNGKNVFSVCGIIL